MRGRIIATAIVAGAALALLTVFVTTLAGPPWAAFGDRPTAAHPKNQREWYSG
jgi:hypothetical protein